MKNGDIVILDKGFANESEVQIKADFDKEYCMVNDPSEQHICWFVIRSRLTPKTINNVGAN